MTGTEYVVAFDSLAQYLDERSKATRLKLETAQAKRHTNLVQFHRGQLDMVQSLKIQLRALREGKPVESVQQVYHLPNPECLPLRERTLLEDE